VSALCAPRFAVGTLTFRSRQRQRDDGQIDADGYSAGDGMFAVDGISAGDGSSPAMAVCRGGLAVRGRWQFRNRGRWHV